MRDTATRRVRAGDVPEDLRVFEERLGDVGARLTLPNARPGDVLPAPLDLGTGLSDEVLRIRRDGSEK